MAAIKREKEAVLRRAREMEEEARILESSYAQVRGCVCACVCVHAGA
jgi:hypothetical protein